MSLSESCVVPVNCPKINRLKYDASESEMNIWLEAASTLTFTFDRILQLSPPAFWSTVVYEPGVVRCLDEVVDALPRKYEVDEYRLIYGFNSSVRVMASRLYYSTLAMFFRLAVFNGAVDATLSEKDYVEIVRGRGILSARRLAALCSLFSEHGPLVIEVVKSHSKQNTRVWFELGHVFVEIGQAVTNLESEARRLISKFYDAKGPTKVATARLVDDWLSTAVALCQEATTVADILCEGGVLEQKSDSVSGVPALVECVAQVFTTEVVFDVAMALSDYPLERLLRLRSQVYKTLIGLYRSVLVRMSDDKKACMIQSTLECQRFIFLLNENENLSELFRRSQPVFREYVERALGIACESETRRTVEELEKFGLLKGLGDVTTMNSATQQAVNEVSQIFPHFSTQYVHLCLRHFGYDVPQTIDALLAPEEKLPMCLRRVEAADLSPRSPNSQPTLPTLSFKDDELMVSSLPHERESMAPSTTRWEDSKGSDQRNVFKGLISLAPLRHSADTSAAPAKEEPKPANEMVRKLREALERIKLRAYDGKHEDLIGVHGERLAPMPTSKTYVSTHNFKVSEADKIAIRPTYEKYRYETRGEDDVYDDEYDDGYEQKEFTVEPLNAQLSSGESDAESAGEPSAVGERGPGMPRGGQSWQRGSRGRTTGGTSGDARSESENAAPAGGGGTSRGSYTGGRQRQVKERHKNAFKQRGADRKMRGAF